jgi:hypothetical protein
MRNYDKWSSQQGTVGSDGMGHEEGAREKEENRADNDLALLIDHLTLHWIVTSSDSCTDPMQMKENDLTLAETSFELFSTR